MNSYKEIDQVFFADGYRLASDIAGDNPDVDQILKMVKSTYESVDGLLESFVARANLSSQKVHCKKSCSWCCHQAVFTNPWESLFLLDHLERNTSAETRELLLERSIMKLRQTKSLSLSALLITRHACPLLDGHNCMIYKARPMACRIYLSMNVDSCINEHHHPEIKDTFPQLYEFPLHAGRMMNEGIKTWFEEKGLYTGELTVESALTSILSESEIQLKWLNGEEIFNK